MLAAKQATKPSNHPITQVEIGIMLATKANGKLLPEEAVSALMEHGFKQLNIDRINAFYANINRATKRILKKIGYIFEAELQDNDSGNSYQYFDQGMWQSNIITHTFVAITTFCALTFP